jgi:hypothetical protein
VSPLERLLGALVHLEGEDALMPLSVLLPLYRAHLAEPALKLLALYEQDEEGALTLISSLHNSQNMYWFDVSMHHNDQDLLFNILIDSIDNLVVFEDPIVGKLDAMASVVRESAVSEWAFFFIRVMYVAATADKALALQHLPCLEPYLDEVVAMVEQGYPARVQLP